MMSMLFFVGIVILLVLEGSSMSYLILKSDRPALILSLSLPMAALGNVLVVFFLTVLGIPLTPLSILLPHAVMLALLFLKARSVTIVARTPKPKEEPETWQRKTLEWLCMALIAVTIVYSFAHAVLLPTFQYDSATNWTMRSEISFTDRKIAFDASEDRGMAKPQYPFLFHALQITANQGQDLGVAQSEAGWNDTAANTILWLLSLSCFAALLLILQLCTSRFVALLTMTMILGIPLLSLHLGQGYADINLLQEMLLSLTCLLAWKREGKREWLLISAMLIASSVWTKSEGVIFGLIPWLSVIAGIAIIDRTQRRDAQVAGLLAVLLSIPWQLFAVSKGLLLTPHSADSIIAFHPEGLPEVVAGLFDRGSFGIAWYVLLIAVPWMIFESTRRRKTDWKETLFLAWGIVVFLEVLFVYLFTPNVRFLLNAESFYRQMMIPAAMLLLSCCVWFGRKETKEEKE